MIYVNEVYKDDIDIAYKYESWDDILKFIKGVIGSTYQAFHILRKEDWVKQVRNHDPNNSPEGETYPRSDEVDYVEETYGIYLVTEACLYDGLKVQFWNCSNDANHAERVYWLRAYVSHLSIESLEITECFWGVHKTNVIWSLPLYEVNNG